MSYCERHPQEQAILTCGNCGKNICTICMTLIGEGVRCQDCMSRLNAAYEDYVSSNAGNANATATSFYQMPTKAPQSKPRPQVDAKGRIIERDTGFRTYWKRTPPRYLIEPHRYLLAGLAALGAALVVGVGWGLLLNANASAIYGSTIPAIGPNTVVTPTPKLLISLAGISYRASIHLLPELLTGVIVAEAIVRATHDRRGRNLQIIAGVGVILAYLVTLATLVIRLRLNTGLGFPAFGSIVGDTGQVLNYIFQSGLEILVFWIIGIVIAVVRLKP